MYHSYHLVTPSYWPLKTALGSGGLVMSLILGLHESLWIYLLFSLMLICGCSYMWWKDVLTESSFLGQHSNSVKFMIRFGVILFIISEVMFFFSFFWAYFHLSLSPSCVLGNEWPPVGIQLFSPFSLPLLNTIILLSSGVTVTCSHMSLNYGNFKNYQDALLVTIMLAIMFMLIQGFEYMECFYSISDSSFGSIFFFTTGFHGLHVMVGTLFLLTMHKRKYHFSINHNLGFESASWYWHFVDVVWLFLFLVVYWWPSF